MYRFDRSVLFVAPFKEAELEVIVGEKNENNFVGTSPRFRTDG